MCAFVLMCLSFWSNGVDVYGGCVLRRERLQSFKHVFWRSNLVLKRPNGFLIKGEELGVVHIADA